MRIIGLIIAALIFIYWAVPYIKDVPRLITGNLYYASGHVFEVRTESKDPFEYIDIDGKTTKFFFDSGIQVGMDYKIGYLPNTHRGIRVELLEDEDSMSLSDKKLGFPFKSILIYLSLIAALVLMIISSVYLKFKSLWFTCIFFYPIAIYEFIKFGLSSGVWISTSNQGFFALALGLISILLLGLIYFIEYYRKGESDVSAITAQFIAVFKLIFIIVAVKKFW